MNELTVMDIELLAPAGNLEKLKIAFQYGADAVYIAGQQFGLRSAADNFSWREIETAINFANQSGKKVYITLNAFPHDDDLAGLPEFVTFLADVGAHGVICSDMGIVDLVRDRTQIPIHISTQASVLNTHHADLWKKKGASRVVVGRELSIAEAGKIKRESGLEVEMFVHGALCMSYSGHCSLSTYIAGRDSNRGGCIQNCRYRYTFSNNQGIEYKANFMSSKDLCGISFLNEFRQAGIDSLKIEGRMKSELYVASTVRAYANALKESKAQGEEILEKWRSELVKIPHRDYTSGWLCGEAGVDSVYDKNRIGFNNTKLAGIVLKALPDDSKFAFQVKNKLLPGDSIELLLFNGDVLPITIEQLVNVLGKQLAVAQPGAIIWLPWAKGVTTGNVARVYRLNG